jgi:hypothetical protein
MKNMFKENKIITIIFLTLFMLFLVMDHFYSKKNNSTRIENQEHSQHEEGASPCGM